MKNTLPFIAASNKNHAPKRFFREPKLVFRASLIALNYFIFNRKVKSGTLKSPLAGLSAKAFIVICKNYILVGLYNYPLFMYVARVL